MKTFNSLQLSLFAFLLFLCSNTLAQKNPVLSGIERVKMFEKHAEMKKDTTFTKLHWQYIGPENISGRCTDVEGISPRGNNYTIGWIG
ncbi:MAG: hypothetical protein HC831_24725, partial [Chloroflexia bacterium]|nr:hypothetical protein [Chloroflexia bacterium]